VKALIVAVVVLSGCATQVPENPWNDIQVPTEATTRPLELPEWPIPANIVEEGAVFDLDGVRALDAYKTTGEANTAIAEAHAGQIDELRTAAKYLVDAGKAQRRVAELRLEILEEERRHWFWERISYWVGLVVIGAAAL